MRRWRDGRSSQQRARGAGGWARLVVASWLSLGVGCVAVRPEQRAILADKMMQFAANARAEAALHHALENREGSLGGGAVQGGGCGCN